MCVCIVKPAFRLSTHSVFNALEHDKLSTADPDELLLPAFLKGIDKVPDDLIIKDLEPPAFTCLLELAALKQELLGVDGFDHKSRSDPF
jgi:hypothetical protein